MLESSLGGPQLHRTEPPVPGPSEGLALLGDPTASSLLTLSRRRKGAKVRAWFKGGTRVLSAPSHGCAPPPGMATLLFPPGEVAVPPPCHPPACAPCRRVAAGEARGHKELPGARGAPLGRPPWVPHCPPCSPRCHPAPQGRLRGLWLPGPRQSPSCPPPRDSPCRAQVTFGHIPITECCQLLPWQGRSRLSSAAVCFAASLAPIEAFQLQPLQGV